MTAVVDLTTTTEPVVVEPLDDLIIEPERHAPELFGVPKPPPSALLTLGGSAAVWLGVALVGWRLVRRAAQLGS